VQFRRLTDDIAVAGQVTPRDLAEVQAAGFKSLVCNRPDGEAPDQPQFASIEAAAQELGLAIRYLPIGHGPMGVREADNFADAVADLPRPILAYCRSGARSAKLVLTWQARVEGDL
jgi:sulfide:quinone oxidoreductase